MFDRKTIVRLMVVGCLWSGFATAEEQVDVRPLPLKTEVTFPKLTWTGWSSENAIGQPSPLRPVTLTNAGDGSGRMFMLTQEGVLHAFRNSDEKQSSSIVLDLTKKVRFDDKEFEEGFLGLAFHPRFKENGLFYIYYTTTESPNVSRIIRFRMTDPHGNVADPSSETEIMHIGQPYWNHNGGTLCFGPDGYLYIGLGDGGKAHDPHGNGQNLGTLLGSILRIDVDHQEGGKQYAIPQDNPFRNQKGACPEIWAYGVRNVWRMSFDRPTGTLWAADVGQDLWEEINHIVRGGNYGWNRREGHHVFDPKQPQAMTPVTAPPAGLIDPIWEYHHNLGKSITGGVVYRGTKLPELQGAYLYGDFISGKMWALWFDPQAGRVTANRPISHDNTPMLTFALDEAGEAFFTTISPSGRGIHHFVRNP